MTPLLLDTCALLWMGSDPAALSTRARAAMGQPGVALFVSAISAWEIGVKQKRGKLTLPEEATRWFPSAVALFGIEVVDIDEGIALNAAVLEWDHRDPADRIVVATALARGMSVVTADSVIASYARVDVVW